MNRSLTSGTSDITGEMIIESKKEDFLNSKINEQRFINYLSDKLESCLQQRSCKTSCWFLHCSNSWCLCQDERRGFGWWWYKLVDPNAIMLIWKQTSCPWHPSARKHKEMGMVHKAVKGVTWSCDLWQSTLYPCHLRLWYHLSTAWIGKGVGCKEDEQRCLFCEQCVQLSTATGQRGHHCSSRKSNGDMMRRITRYFKTVSKSASFVEREGLPPTSAAAGNHNLCLYYQIREWKRSNTQNEDRRLRMVLCGWKVYANTNSSA